MLAALHRSDAQSSSERPPYPGNMSQRVVTATRRAQRQQCPGRKEHVRSSAAGNYSHGSSALSIRAVMVGPADRTDLGLVERRTGQDREGAELPAITVRGHEVLLGRGLGDVRVTVSEGRHVPLRHLRTDRWLPAVVDRELACRQSLRSSRATSPRRR